MLGMAKLSSGQTLPLKAGVEVEIVQIEPASSTPTSGTTAPIGIAGESSISDDEEAWDCSLRATRRFVITGDLTKSDKGFWNEAEVRFLDSQTEEREEVARFNDPTAEESIGGRLGVARAIAKAKTFTE